MNFTEVPNDFTLVIEMETGGSFIALVT